MRLKNAAVAITVWAVISAVTLGILYANLTAMEMMLMFPRKLSEIALVRLAFFALPCALTAALVFALTAPLRPSARTLILTGLAAFVVIGVFLTLAGLAIRAGAMPEYRQYGARIILLALLSVVAAFTLPPVLISPGKRIIWGLWWQPVLVLIALGIFLTGVEAMLPDGIPAHLARLAEHLGGHYYTALNFAGPAIQILAAVLTASSLGLAWARAYDRRLSKLSGSEPVTR